MDKNEQEEDGDVEIEVRGGEMTMMLVGERDGAV